MSLRIGTLEYFASNAETWGFWTNAAGEPQRFLVGANRDLLPLIDALRAELRDPTALALGRVPRLHGFMNSWGRAFLPPGICDELDVLVVVPHAFCHDLPLHLVTLENDGAPIGTRIGMTYISSRSLFRRCASRNPARASVVARPRSIDIGGTDVFRRYNHEFATICAEIAALFAEDRGRRDDWSFCRVDVKSLLWKRRKAVDVLCILGHGYLDEDDHRFSGLLLDRVSACASRSVELPDGRRGYFKDLPIRHCPHAVRTRAGAELLTAEELGIAGEFNGHLVALLACSAGAGRVLEGDEPASIAEKFLHLGAPSAVAPMWDCHIDAVRAWTHRFFTCWVQEQMPKALAFRATLASMCTGEFSEHPERFGAMSLRGDWL